MHRPRIRQPRVVALPDDWDDHLAKGGCAGHEQLAGRVIDTTDLHGRGEKDWCLGVAPLLNLRAPGQLTRSIEHSDTCWNRISKRIATGVDHCHAGAGNTAADRWRGFVVFNGDVPNTNARHILDAGGRAGRKGAEGDAEISYAHPTMLSGYGTLCR